MIQSTRHPRHSKPRSSKGKPPRYYLTRWNRTPGFVESPRTSPKHIHCTREETIGQTVMVVTYRSNKKGNPARNNNGGIKASLNSRRVA